MNIMQCVWNKFKNILILTFIQDLQLKYIIVFIFCCLSNGCGGDWWWIDVRVLYRQKCKYNWLLLVTDKNLA